MSKKQEEIFQCLDDRLCGQLRYSLNQKFDSSLSVLLRVPEWAVELQEGKLLAEYPLDGRLRKLLYYRSNSRLCDRLQNRLEDCK